VKERLFKLIRGKYETDVEFEKALGLKEKTVDTWKRGKSSAYLKMLPELCEHFQVSADYLLGRSDNTTYSALNIRNSNLAQRNNAKIVRIVTPKEGAEAEEAKEANKTDEFEELAELTIEELDLLRIFKILNGKRRHTIMDLTYKMEEEYTRELELVS